MIGIYKIENLINHKCYLGQSIHIERRWQEHCRPSGKSMIAKAIQKYGKENFSFQIIEECTEDDLDEKEIYYINKFNSIVPNGYNIKDYIEKGETTFTIYDKDTFLEIVKEIKDNLLTFQEIAEKYDLSKRTITRINNGHVHKLDTENYPLRTITVNNQSIKPNGKKKNYCIDCGAEITNKALRCTKCSHKAQRISERPSRDMLKELIRTTSFVKIGEQYNVTDNAIKSWCKSYKLPFKKSDIKLYTDEQWEKI